MLAVFVTIRCLSRPRNSSNCCTRELGGRPFALNSDLSGVKWSEITLLVPQEPRRPLVDAAPPKVEAYFTAVHLSGWVGSGGS